MDETEKYLFEVHGYLVIKEVLTPEQLAEANLAVDRHADQIQLRPNDLANESQTLRYYGAWGFRRNVDLGKTVL